MSSTHETTLALLLLLLMPVTCHGASLYSRSQAGHLPGTASLVLCATEQPISGQPSAH